MNVDKPYEDIEEAVKRWTGEFEDVSEAFREDNPHMDVEGTASHAGIKEAVEQRDEQTRVTPDMPKQSIPSKPKPEIDAWQGAWLLIFTFFLAVTLAVTGLSLLFDGPSPFGTYWFFWGILALLVIIYPIARFVERCTDRR